MKDHAWIRNLARAAFADGKWRHPDEQQIQQLLQRRIDEALPELHADAEETAEIMQELSGGRRNPRVLPLHDKSGGMNGFTLMLARCQVTLERTVGGLQMSLVTFRGFDRQVRPLMRLTPAADPFGSLVWNADIGVLLTPELIVKRMFEDVTRAAFQTGELTLTPHDDEA